MSFSVIIPARYASTRLPGKLLLDVAGKPLIQRVYDKALESGADQVIIATDNERIESIAKDFGADVCMTSTQHNSGTERLAEVVTTRNFSDDSVVVNLQGDEPLMPPQLIELVAEKLLIDKTVSVSTLCHPITTLGELFNPNVVKVVMDSDGNALYFSRAPIPWDRERFKDIYTSGFDESSELTDHYRHIGLYAYSVGFIKQYVNLEPSKTEKLELLEQLRVLDQGYKIAVSTIDEDPGIGVDTEEDLNRVRKLFTQ